MISERTWRLWCAVVREREDGWTFSTIAHIHGFSTSYAHALYQAATWPTDVAERERQAAQRIYGIQLRR